MKTRMIAAALMLMTGSTAQADECDIMPAKIAKSMHLVVDPKRTQHHFIQMTSDGEYGAQLNCDQDHLGLNLHVISLPDVLCAPANTRSASAV